MDKTRISFSIILALIVINSIGILLKYFGLSTYLIFFGFRFHLSLFLPVLIVARRNQKDLIKNIFIRPAYKKSLFYICLLILPISILFAALYIAKKIELGNPEYFYEFGLSSIVDFPIYLVWNSIQLMFFYTFLIIVSSESLFKFLSVVLIFISLFAYEFIPLNRESLDYHQIASLILFALVTGIQVKYFQNIYWLIIFSFSILWLNVLMLGSKSEMIIKLFFAAQYNSWEGFFSVSKGYKDFLLPAHLLLVIIFLLFTLPVRKVKSKMS